MHKYSAWNPGSGVWTLFSSFPVVNSLQDWEFQTGLPRPCRLNAKLMSESHFTHLLKWSLPSLPTDPSSAEAPGSSRFILWIFALPLLPVACLAHRLFISGSVYQSPNPKTFLSLLNCTSGPWFSLKSFCFCSVIVPLDRSQHSLGTEKQFPLFQRAISPISLAEGQMSIYGDYYPTEVHASFQASSVSQVPWRYPGCPLF